MKNEDLQLAEKTTNNNRDRFVEALAYHKGKTIAQQLRSGIGIPLEGFETPKEANAWLRPLGIEMRDISRRHMELGCAARVMLEKLHLTENYYATARYFLLSNRIGHIPGNFSVSIIHGSRRLTMTEDAPLMTEENKLLGKLKKEIHKVMGNKNRRTRKNAKKSAKELDLHNQKGVLNGVDSDTGLRRAMIKTDRDIAAYMNTDDLLASTKKEKKEINAIKQNRFRAKKRAN